MEAEDEGSGLDEDPTAWAGPDAFADLIYEKIERSDHPTGVSPEAIKATVRACYGASLQREEGRPTGLHVFLLPRSNLPSSLLVELDEPEPVTPENLRRRAPAIPPRPLGAVIADSDGMPVLLGWTRVDHRRFDLVSGELDIRIEGGIWLRVFGPGAIEAFSVHPHPSHAVLQLYGGKTRELRRTYEMALEASGLLEHPSQASLLQILPEAHRLGHGGAFLFLPPDLTLRDALAEGGPIKWCRRTRGPDMASLMESAAREASRRGESLTLRRVANAATCIAHLSAVDGAVVLDRSVHVHGFAAEIRAEGGRPDLTVWSVQTGEPENFYLRGMRHRSAAAYCTWRPGCVAVVISQDGGLLLLRQRKDEKLEMEGPFHELAPYRPQGTYD